MITREKRWNLLGIKAEKAAALKDQLHINPVLCRLLSARGYDSFDKAKDFFRPSLNSLHNPWLMKDMDKAVVRILNAFALKEKILVWGDYDVDGTTAVACMVRFLHHVYDKGLVDFYIPHRYHEGYGISKKGIDHANDHGYTLIIALDCGVKSVAMIGYAATLGIDFIVCDHHLPDDELPVAVAILNPKQKDCNYPFKDLCGCGVGFKLIAALAERLCVPEEITFSHLDLIATAIAADIVSMTGENRVLAYYGLKKANESPNPGIWALIILSEIKSKLLISNLVFMIAPRINAAGRMDDARKAVQMFISDTPAEAMHYARMLHTDNKDRKEADVTITEEALFLIKSNEAWVNRKSTVVYQSHWHKGVVGIVASRLIDHYYRPTIVLTQSGEFAAGSARSVAGFNVYEALHQCKDLLLGYGGHFYAAGMTLELNKIEAFQEKFEAIVSGSIPAELLIPEIIIDAEVSFNDLNQSFYNILCQMEPFGPDNLRPVFVARNVIDTGSKLVKDQHIKFSLKQGNVFYSGIGFGMADKIPLLQNNTPIDVVFTLDVNEWNDCRYLQMRVIDIRPANSSTMATAGI
jgi:single-stranded-DNA-specific exonuclease